MARTICKKNTRIFLQIPLLSSCHGGDDGEFKDGAGVDFANGGSTVVLQKRPREYFLKSTMLFDKWHYFYLRRSRQVIELWNFLRGWLWGLLRLSPERNFQCELCIAPVYRSYFFWVGGICLSLKYKISLVIKTVRYITSRPHFFKKMICCSSNAAGQWTKSVLANAAATLPECTKKCS